MTAPEMILTETTGRVAVITLNRPKALNALCDQLMAELGAALLAYDADPAIGCIVLTGSERAFAAGADIKEMKDRSYPDVMFNDFIAPWDTVTRINKPVVAAVSGLALGGGCELAMMCDLIIAADTARFGQPEINLGVIPGSGGTQRLTRAIGKAKAMDLVLTGRMMDAAEAERCSLVARIVPAADLLAETMKIAEKIASQSSLAAMLAKKAVNAAFETHLAEGVRTERALFLPMFGTEGQREGMAAFTEKRAAIFHR